MKVTGIRLRVLTPPKDDVFGALRASKLSPKDGDVIAISSKIVSIGEGRTVPVAETEKDELIKQESDWYLKLPGSRWRRWFTIARGVLIGSAGIDESNSAGHYTLYPADAFKSARRLRTWLMREYGAQRIGVIITDSTSMPLRRGAIGFALAWDGIDPLRDYRGTKDIFGRTIEIEMANLIDGLAAAAVLEMGEGREQTPVAVIRDAKGIVLKNRARSLDQLLVEPEDDLFAPLLFTPHPWKKGSAPSARM